MFRLEKSFATFALKINWIAGGAVVAMMLLTTADIVLRAFRHPIPGAYEIVGLIGSLSYPFHWRIHPFKKATSRLSSWSTVWQRRPRP